MSRIIFGVGVGMWIASWLSIISPMVPFVAAYPFMFWAMWLLSDPNDKRATQ